VIIIDKELLKEIVYTLVQLIPIGKVTTYSSVAKLIGRSPRLVARLLKENDKPIVIPCHRVVYKDGRIGGYSYGGQKVKRRLLELEGVRIRGEKVEKRYIIDIEEVFNEGEVIEIDI
jgi:methylated-DNA-[protein]-cysteine S-methyltransferase